MSDRRVGRATSRHATTVVAAVLCLGVLAGCNDEPDDTASTDEPSATTTESATDEPPTEEPTETTPTEPTETESSQTAPPDDNPNDSAASRAKKAQIPAKKLPGFNDQWEWAKQSSGPGLGQDMPSVCMQAPFSAIGATEDGQYRTDFNSPLDDRSWAVQQTVVMPDEQTGKRVEAVLTSWQQKCAKQAKKLGLKKVDVSPATEVPTATGTGTQWLVTYRPVPGDPDASWLQAEGFVRDGDTLTYLVMTTAGQDYNYESGQEPMAQALQVAAKRLLASR